MDSPGNIPIDRGKERVRRDRFAQGKRERSKKRSNAPIERWEKREGGER